MASCRAITIYIYILTQVQSAVPHISLLPIFLLHVSFAQNHLQAVHQITHTHISAFALCQLCNSLISCYYSHAKHNHNVSKIHPINKDWHHKVCCSFIYVSGVPDDGCLQPKHTARVLEIERFVSATCIYIYLLYGQNFGFE